MHTQEYTTLFLPIQCVVISYKANKSRVSDYCINKHHRTFISVAMENRQIPSIMGMYYYFYYVHVSHMKISKLLCIKLKYHNV